GRRQDHSSVTTKRRRATSRARAIAATDAPVHGEDRVSYRRFWIAFAAWLAILAVIAGSAHTLQVTHALRTFVGLELASRVVSLAFVREFAGGVVFVTALFAWVTWTHGQDAELVRGQFRATALRVMLSAPVAYVVATFCAIATSFFLMASFFGITASQSLAGYRGIIFFSDWVVGTVTTVSALAVLVLVAWFAMPRLAATPWGLPRKLFTAWLGVAAMRVCVALVETVTGFVFG
ncbi:MAG TPA: hypothetical protein VMS65_09460, partial [Polyangiaceae bacterium]|nr:hypothetical protein [Polyangiaceae bacterium]